MILCFLFSLFLLNLKLKNAVILELGKLDHDRKFNNDVVWLSVESRGTWEVLSQKPAR